MKCLEIYCRFGNVQPTKYYGVFLNNDTADYEAANYILDKICGVDKRVHSDYELKELDRIIGFSNNRKISFANIHPEGTIIDVNWNSFDYGNILVEGVSNV